MKRGTLALITIFILLQSHAQKVSVADLTGTWALAGQPPDSVLNRAWGDYTFIDGTRLNITIMGITVIKFTYRIDTTGTITKLFIKGKTQSGLNLNDVWLVKKAGTDTLKKQSMSVVFAKGVEHTQPNQWQNPETDENTGFLYGKKISKVPVTRYPFF